MSRRIGQVRNRRQQRPIKTLQRRARAQSCRPIGMRQRAASERDEVCLLPRHHPAGRHRVMQRPVGQYRDRNVLPRQCREAWTLISKSRTPSLELGRVQVVDGLRAQRAVDLRRIGLAAFPLVAEVIDLALRAAHAHDIARSGSPAHGLDDLHRQAQPVVQLPP